MLTSYFTLKRLVDEWRAPLTGSLIREVYTQDRGELTIVLEQADETDREPVTSLKISLLPPLRFLSTNPGQNRARKNVSNCLPDAVGDSVSTLVIAGGDRIITMFLSSGRRLLILPFGPRANVYLVNRDGRVQDRFREQGVSPGQALPVPRQQGIPVSSHEFDHAWSASSGKPAVRIAATCPQFGGIIARELARRAAFAPDSVRTGTQDLFPLIQQMMDELLHAEPRVYTEQASYGGNDDRIAQFSLIELPDGGFTGERRFDSVNEAVRFYVKQHRGQSAFEKAMHPIFRALERRREKITRSGDRMREALQTDSRADLHEKRGHLLMAAQSRVPRRATSVELEDIISGTGTTVIPLDPGLSAIENAELYYRRARNGRRAHQSATIRYADLQQTLMRVDRLIEALQSAKTVRDIRAFNKEYREELAHFLGQKAGNTAAVPFRTYRLEGGFEVWVGKNAAQNDRLTQQYARKFDFWFHARGVSGSHVVLRRPGRTSIVPGSVLEKAASIAAWHSKARTSTLVPVIMAEKKFVRKPKKSPPGTIVVEREQVILVKPELPSAD